MKFHFLIRIACMCFLILSSACQSVDKKEKSSQEIPTEQNEVALSTPGSITVEEMQLLWDRCDYIDVIFFNSAVSISQEEQSGIRQTIQFISKKPATLNPSCNPAGRISFLIAGDIHTEADIYLDQGCTYFAFIRDGKITSANQISPKGINFLSQVTKTQPPANG